MTRFVHREWPDADAPKTGFVPKIQETRVLFSKPPFYFPDFVGRALAFLQSDTARKMQFHFEDSHILPCKWKCSDESLFQVDLSLYSMTGLYPFDKGLIGGYFNQSSLGAAIHHGGINIDFGGSHVGYVPGPGGGSFGHIWRPQHHCHSTDCGHLMSVITPFISVYQDACDNIFLYSPDGERLLVSIPNEFLQPLWSTQRIKLKVDLPHLTAGAVEYREDLPYTHTSISRSLFRVNPAFLEELNGDDARPFWSPQPKPIGRHLTPAYFDIYDAQAEMDEQGLPRQRLMLYMKYIVATQYSPPALKAAIVNTNLEHNRLADAVRAPQYADYAFASFTGIFIDLYDDQSENYLNLFQPIAMAIKPRGRQGQVEILEEEIYRLFENLKPVPPKVALYDRLTSASISKITERFTYRPGYFQKFDPQAAADAHPPAP